MKTVKPTRQGQKKQSKKKKKPFQEKAQKDPNIKGLLHSRPKFDLIIPKRRKWRLRAAVFE
jgi:hypothetical protein